ncbi:MAG: hypothetical protein KFF73_07900 [Cyclobacteriaceae bacterium]|nr:hypothetical protein [Cyclobacteriaceae bacterium]
MLDYVKTILIKVSFDGNLFEKELSKAIGILLTEELKELRRWCYVQFGHIYSEILNKHFIQI